MTGGFQRKKNRNRLYMGTRVSVDNYFPWGYLSSNLEYGTFFHSSQFEEGVFYCKCELFYRINRTWQMENQAIRKATAHYGL